MTSRVFLSAPALVNALGSDTDTVTRRLFAGDTAGMVLQTGWLTGERPARVGAVRDAPPPADAVPASHAGASTRWLLAALAQLQAPLDVALARYGADRIGVVLGTSTSGIAEGERAVALRDAEGRLPASYAYTQQEIGMPAPFLAAHLGLQGPAYTISTACTSGAKAFASARQLLAFGVCDAVLVGGVDSLARLTLRGFEALDSITDGLCNPMSVNRRGINIGEGATLFLMTREETDTELVGVGETGDAHHMSAPHPEGLGASSAMQLALADAGLAPADIGYLNLHATATPKNDAAESLAVARVFPDGVPASGTKPMTGHQLGNAGATELAFCWMALQHGRLPPHLWDGAFDTALPRLDLVDAQGRALAAGRRCAMSSSFAFGGNNAVLVIRRNG